jgi:hypothetical protein
LDGGQEVFLLATGFENGPEESRGELAGELRQLAERYPALHQYMGCPFQLDRNDRGRYVNRVPLCRQLILRDAPSVKLRVEVDSWKSSRMQSGPP